MSKVSLQHKKNIATTHINIQELTNRNTNTHNPPNQTDITIHHHHHHQPAPIHQHHQPAPINHHHQPSPINQHHQPAPIHQHHQPAPINHHHQPSPINYHHQPSPINHHHQPAPIHQHHQPAPINHHHQPAPINHHHQPAPINHHPSTKLYTFCAHQNKSNISFSIEDNTTHQSLLQRERKASMSNIRGKIYHPKSKSKSKQKLSSLQNGCSFMKNKKECSLSGCSVLSERKKLQNMMQKGEQKVININISKASLKVHKRGDKENKCSKSNISRPKDPKESPDIESLQIAKPLSNRQQLKITSTMHTHTPKVISIREEELQQFINTHACEKIKLEEVIEKLQGQKKGWGEKEVQWEYFQKDSRDYIDFLQRQRSSKDKLCRQLQEQLHSIQQQHQYFAIAKQQYKSTIDQQNKEILYLHQQLQQQQNRIAQHSNSVDSQSKNASGKQRADKEKQKLASCEVLSIENDFLNKQLQLNERFALKYLHYSNHGRAQNSATAQVSQSNSELKTANQLLTAQIKSLYIHKINAEVYRKTLEQYCHSNCTLKQQCAKLHQQLHDNQSIKSINWANSEMDQNDEEKEDDKSKVSMNEFRLNLSGSSGCSVVLWKNERTEEGIQRWGLMGFQDNLLGQHKPRQMNSGEDRVRQKRAEE